VFSYYQIILQVGFLALLAHVGALNIRRPSLVSKPTCFSSAPECGALDTQHALPSHAPPALARAEDGSTSEGSRVGWRRVAARPLRAGPLGTELKHTVSLTEEGRRGVAGGAPLGVLLDKAKAAAIFRCQTNACPYKKN
jgi:hypothetical protein